MASSPYLWLFSYSCFIILSSFCNCRVLLSPDPLMEEFTLDSLRDSLTRQEDSIVFSLIERAKYPYNAPTYSNSYLDICKNHSTLLSSSSEKQRQFTPIIHSCGEEGIILVAGRYQNPEELPFFPHDLPLSRSPPYNFSQLLYPASAYVNVSKTIWDMYFNQLLPLFTSKGDDGNYGLTSMSDLLCLQLLSRRIHYGRFVAEVKFRDAPNDYISRIRAQDKDALMKLVTSESVEEMVQRRVKKKAMIFGQDVTLESKNNMTEYKVNPSAVFQLYKEWVIPLTKVVEVEYLLHRLD